MTFLRARVQGCWFYLFLILDPWSRKIVGFEVHDTDQAEHAAHLARRTTLAEDNPRLRAPPRAARRQRREREGHHRAGHARLARHHAVALAPPGQR
ncbi:hypothetical protein SKB0092_40290 (plasmid) [Roseomonas mucosa]